MKEQAVNGFIRLRSFLSSRQQHFSPSLSQNLAWDSHLIRLLSFNIRRFSHIIELNLITSADWSVLSFLVQTKELNSSRHFRYKNFNTTTIQSATLLCLGSLWDTLNSDHIGRHSAHRSGSLSRSLKEPLQDSCSLCPGWPVTSMRLIRYSLSYQRQTANSFVNNLVLFEMSSNDSLSFRSLTITWHLMMLFLHRSIP